MDVRIIELLDPEAYLQFLKALVEATRTDGKWRGIKNVLAPNLYDLSNIANHVINEVKHIEAQIEREAEEMRAKKEAEAIAEEISATLNAVEALLNLREMCKEVNGGEIPEKGHAIKNICGRICIRQQYGTSEPLMFHSRKDALEFVAKHFDLLKQARPLF
jgi:hypothetical protein